MDDWLMFTTFSQKILGGNLLWIVKNDVSSGSKLNNKLPIKICYENICRGKTKKGGGN